MRIVLISYTQHTFTTTLFHSECSAHRRTDWPVPANVAVRMAIPRQPAFRLSGGGFESQKREGKMLGNCKRGGLLLAVVFAALAMDCMTGWAAYRPHYYSRSHRYHSYRPYYHNRYRRYNYGYGSPLNGVASIINARANFMKQAENARLLREKVNQAKLDTRKKTIQELLYERDNLPTYQDDVERTQQLRLRAALEQPPTNEITSGRALNTLLPSVRDQIQQGIFGPPHALDPALLQSINATTAHGNNPGLLKDGGKMAWPVALRGVQQEQLQQELVLAVQEARNNALTPEILAQIRSGVAALDASLSTGIRAEKIDTQMYLSGKRFLDGLNSAVRVLEQPDASKILSGAATLHGQTVEELVANMTHDGLEFAPALPGEEAAYISLYHSLRAYLGAAQQDMAFGLPLAPTGGANPRPR